jgi:hypothetical protein
MWHTMIQQCLDHVTMAIFDRGDERGHTVLVLSRNEHNHMRSALDKMESLMKRCGTKKI